MVLEIYWHPLTIAERESIQKALILTMRDFALGMMIRKALDADGKRLFQDGEKAVLKNLLRQPCFRRFSLPCCLLERKARWRKRRQTSNNGDWFFIYALAKELGMTVAQLSQTLRKKASRLGSVLRAKERARRKRFKALRLLIGATMSRR